jgi:hypothetical protein
LCRSYNKSENKVKQADFKRLLDRTELKTTTLEIFDYFSDFFVIISVR